MKRAFIVLAACGVFASAQGCGSNAQETPQVVAKSEAALTVSGNHVTGWVPQHGSLDLDAQFECGNKGGQFSFTGIVLLDGVAVTVIAQNNAKGTHADSAESKLDVVLSADKEFNAKPGWGNGGVGGNPWILFQPVNGSGQGVADAVVLGRCHGKAAKKHFDLAKLLAYVDFTGDADGCDKTGGPAPKITLEGTIASGALKGKIWFVNSIQSPNPHVVEWTNPDLTLDIILEDKVSFNVSNQFGDGVGGNPLIYLQVAPDPKVLLGRCNKL
jgi:hypothetical protein